MEVRKSDAIDYVKCIGIILVIFGHYPNTIINVLKPYIFHMPLFFFLGGMLVNTNKTSKQVYITAFKRYFLYIIFSYIILGVSTDVLHYLFGTQKLNVFAGLRTPALALESNFHNNFFFITGWFLVSYMFVSCLCPSLLKLIYNINNSAKRMILLVSIAIAFGFLGMNVIAPEYNSSKLFYINILSQILVGSCFYILGYAARDHIWSLLNPIVAFIL
ncbi:TPA: acyltransferase family protein, partial [Escherichia coli]|nr:acyltransferase family protein [Escherichia coli]